MTSSKNSQHSASPDDHLLGCLGYLAAYFDKPFTPDAAIAGLPLDGAKLSPSLFPRSAARFGLEAKLVSRSVCDVPSMVAPFIALLKNGEAVIVLAVEKVNNKLTVVQAIGFEETEQQVDLDTFSDSALDHVIFVTPSRAAGERDAVSSNLHKGVEGRWFWPIVRGYWPSWGMVFVSAMLINILALAIPLFIMNVYDRVIPNLAIPTLWALAGGVVLALGFDFLLKVARASLLDRTGQRIEMKVSSNIFERAIGIRSDHMKDTAGNLANTVREFETVRDFFTSGGIIAMTDFLFVGIFIFVLMVIVGPLAYVPMVAVALVLLSTFLFQIPLNRAITATMREAGERQSILVETLVGLDAIRANGAEGSRQRAWEGATASTAKFSSNAKFWASLASSFSALIMQSVSVVIIVLGVYLVIDGSITVGALIAANILSGRVLGPLSNIAQTLARSQHAFAALRAINTIMQLPSERTVEGRTVTSGQSVDSGDVRFERVGFSYPDMDTAVLEEVSVSIASGTSVGLIGDIGAGKSTIGKLLAGFYDCTSGTIFVDGLDVRQYDTASLRRNVAYVPQDPALFTGSIRDNIALGLANASGEQIAEAVKLAGAEEFVSRMPRGLATIVVERGANLSGGQKQVIALARAILRQPKILFLDEPTNSMDPKTERNFIEHLETLKAAGHTIIVASHKASIIRSMDQLVVLQDGRATLSGPRDEVLAKGSAGNASKVGKITRLTSVKSKVKPAKQRQVP